MELISRRTRREFRNYLSTWVLGQIRDFFDAAGIEPRLDLTPPHVQGQRRTLVEQYYAGITWDSPRDVRKVLSVLEEILEWSEPSEQMEHLVRCLERDGYVYENGRLRPTAPIGLDAIGSALDPADRQLLDDHLRRIGDNLDEDPALAVGSAKELVETTAKLVIRACGSIPDESDSVPKLVKRALTSLNPGLDEAARASESLRQIAGGLAQVVAGTAELRNQFGTGHGRLSRARIEARHARLVIGAATTLCSYLLETLDARQPPPSG